MPEHRASRTRGAPGSLRAAPFLPVALLLAGCGTVAPSSPVPGAPEHSTATSATTPFPQTPVLSPGERWFVMVHPSTGNDVYVVRARRTTAGDDGLVRDESAWGRSFQAVARGETGPAKVTGSRVDANGLQSVALDGEGRPVGDPVLEVGAPFGPGTAWTARAGDRLVHGRIEAIEDVEVPLEIVRGTLRVVHDDISASGAVMITWYDDTLRPVRAEVRDARGRLLEARAMVRGDPPDPLDCRAALDWARKRLR